MIKGSSFKRIIKLGLAFLFCGYSFFNCSFRSVMVKKRGPSSGDQLFSESANRQAIVIHPFDPGGDDGDPDQFARKLISTFGPSSSWTGMDLGFVLLVNPMQERDESIVQRINSAFRVARELNLRLLIHINHEWLFGFFPSYDVQYGNSQIEKITGVRPLGYNNYQRIDDSPQVVQRVEWKSWTEPLSQYSLYWGSESIQPPKINYLNQDIRLLLSQKAEVVRGAIERNLAGDLREDSSLFLGIDIGWETSLDDQDEKVPLGFRAMMDSGYASGQLSEEQKNEFLGQVAADFIAFGASLYRSSKIPNQKIFSHYLLLDQDKHFPGYKYERWIRNPAHLAKLQELTPGFSMYCTTQDCSEIADELQQAAPGAWAVTESHPVLLSTLIHGFPSLNIQPPQFMTLYAFGANIVNDSHVIQQITDLLTGKDPDFNSGEPTPQPSPPAERLPAGAVGYIDGSGEGPNGSVGVGGWACVPKVADSIRVKIYVGGPRGTGGVYLGETIANNLRDEGVAANCQTHFFNYGFGFLISPQSRALHANKDIYVYGISSPFGGHDEPLNNSGKFKVLPPPKIDPSPNPPEIISGNAIGYIDGVGEGENGSQVVGGWTCVPGNSQSIGIQIYAGSSVDYGGNLIGEEIAQRDREQAVSNLCKTTFQKYGFAIAIKAEDRVRLSGKKIYVRGVSKPYGGNNELLSNSGNFTISH